MANTQKLEEQALAFVKNKVTAWRDAHVFVIPQVSYNVRNVVKKARKNYWGVFNTPYDEVTGHKKVFVPLTQTVIENLVKNTDVDTKDINLKAKGGGYQILTKVNKAAVRDYLKKSGFGQFLDEINRMTHIDGTGIAKIFETKDKDGKPRLAIKVVDRLNFYIDPSADCIQEADCVERIIMDIDEFNAMPFINKDKVEGTDVDPYEDFDSNVTERRPQVELYEFWGLMPQKFMSGEGENMIDGRIVISRNDDNWVLHKVEKMKGKYKPYEDLRFTKAPGRFDGLGSAEKLFMLQEYINEIVNLRVANSRIFQVGLFKARKGSGVTSKKIQGLIAGGVITVDQLSDIEQFDLRNPSLNDSIADEQNMVNWANKVTQSAEVSAGDNLPASTTATTAAISNQNSKTGYALMQEQFGMFLQRVLERHVLPILKKIVTQDDILRITGELSDLTDIDQAIVQNITQRAVSDYILSNGVAPSPEFVAIEQERALEELKKQGKERYATSKVFLNADYDVEVYVTNEDFDKNTIAQNIKDILFNVAPQNQNIDVEGLTAELLDIIGVGGQRFVGKQNQEAVAGRGQQIEQQPAPAGDVLSKNNTPQTPGQLIADSTKQAVQGNL